MKMVSPSRQLLFGLAALCLAVGSIVVVFTLTWVIVTPEFISLDKPTPIPGYAQAPFYGGFAVVLMGIVICLLMVLNGQRIEAIEPDRSQAMFGSVLVGLGFIFLIDAILNLIAFSGFARTGLLSQLFPAVAPDASVLEASNAVSAIRLVVSLGMAVLGALFFVMNSLRKKRDGQIRYSATKFWSGLSFRLGEAVLFTVVFFLALRHYVPDGDQLLPLIALLLGMFVTTGETLVFGLAQPRLQGAAALVGTDSGTQTPDARTGGS